MYGIESFMKQLPRGFLIAIEGIDGSGKSTLAQAIFDHLTQEKFSVVVTKEPGGSSLGKILRPILQEQKVKRCALAEFFLFAADRAQHFDEIIIPALEQKFLVISDRLSDSSLVYQGFGRGLSLSLLETVNQWAMQNNKPDITLYLKVPLEIALSRLGNRETATTFEKDLQLLQNSIKGFDTLYANRNDVIILDAQQDPQLLCLQAIDALKQKLSLNL